MDWLAALRGLPEGALWMQHRPLTPRYVRAGIKIPLILRSAMLLGTRPAEKASHTELATWSPAPDGRSAGFYCCFRVFFGPDGPIKSAALFCFYDGRDQSPAIHSVHLARAFARNAGFQEDPNEHIH